jgi:hypothetical protein
MCNLCLSLRGAGRLQPAHSGTIAAATLRLAQDILATDVLRQCASRRTDQYTSLSKGSSAISGLAGSGFAVFCLVTTCRPMSHHLAAVRAAYGLTAAGPADYETVRVWSV